MMAEGVSTSPHLVSTLPLCQLPHQGPSPSHIACRVRMLPFEFWRHANIYTIRSIITMTTFAFGGQRNVFNIYPNIYLFFALHSFCVSSDFYLVLFCLQFKKVCASVKRFSGSLFYYYFNDIFPSWLWMINLA